MVAKDLMEGSDEKEKKEGDGSGTVYSTAG